MSLGTGGFINPQRVIDQIGLKKDMQVADFGCGHGYFTLPVAKIVGKEGKVYAVDILEEALEAVNSIIKINGLTNTETRRGNLESVGGSGLADGQVDFVLLHNVLFQSQKKSEIIIEAKRVLKIGGIFALVDWQKNHSSIGPQGGWRMFFDEAKNLVQEEGLTFSRVFDAGEFHYGLIFVKP